MCIRLCKAHIFILCIIGFGILFSACAAKVAVETTPPQKEKETTILPEPEKEKPKEPIITHQKIMPYVQEVPEGLIVVSGGSIHTFINTDPATSSAPTLKSFSVREEKYSLPNKNPADVAFSTTARASWSTLSGRQKDFMVVQFMRGCKWDTVCSTDGTFIDYPDWTSKEFVPMPVGDGFPVWVLPRIEKKADDGTIIQEPHVLILPYGSSFDPFTKYPNARRGIAHNTAFEMKTCIYKAEDVSGNMNEEEVLTKTPIACIVWESCFVYDVTEHRVRECFDIDSFYK